MTPADLDRLEALHAAATPGADLDLIVAMRNALPELIAMARFALSPIGQMCTEMKRQRDELRAERDALARECESRRFLMAELEVVQEVDRKERDALAAQVAKLGAALAEIAQTHDARGMAIARAALVKPVKCSACDEVGHTSAQCEPEE